MSKYLYGASIKGIQSYIFTTNELKSIMGASKIIENFNECISKKFKQNIIINAAGNIKLIFGENEYEKLENLVLKFPKYVAQKAYGIEFCQAVIKFEEGELKEAFKELEINLAVQRNKPSLPLDFGNSFIKIAPKSGRAYVENEMDMATFQKNETIDKFLKDNKEIKTNIPKNHNNKTAIIHADGNSLGVKIASMLENLKNDDEVRKTYFEFSLNLKNATDNAYEKASLDIPKNKIRKIILSGDDLSIVCDANFALVFCQNFIKEFEVQTKNLMKTKLTMCAGIAYCHEKFPFHYAISLAEQLCVNAKKYSKYINKTLPPSSIMFHNIQSSSYQNYDDFIVKELTLRNDKESIRLDFGAYFLESQSEFASISNFIKTANLLKAKTSPRSRLRDYLSILSTNSNEALLRLERIKEMLILKNEFNIEEFEKSLKSLNEQLSFTHPFILRDNEKFCPIYDLISYISIICGDKNEKN